ncbi:hypothetical protein [Dyadobacter sp. CY326]|uniref:hypothetical protein n=1 Tax=Dyadobacter sp. CY326 TaxID=2907300 RepID=UPI001F407A84|nr:hypothetical protein [Dyadobacter sp. CY326]MCE7066955.1 hypothetical protein [Dyadobacter sp. CY326]
MAVIKLKCVEIGRGKSFTSEAQQAEDAEFGGTIFLEKAVAENDASLELIEQHFTAADLCTIEVRQSQEVVTTIQGIIRSFENNGDDQQTLLDLEIELL